ncbi:MarR family transcriptional regulator [Dactylosporangium aurantiacum]|uniref:MarR family transcriptional regulator n=1 Tax=Dactylosporangium aurantiacum TaxID=35754 RepID=A0A9Q9MHC7_9ACTN|nr:MarR family transcriptional regulator [Dactylosporangium aurantiacum]MDG6101684.1 MarR family transcriptional regulator [Dactylosporangium aurantiacum]UWZ52496.1 MarR family transcriptional regulator [Dactylosporangium aurantiacum]
MGNTARAELIAGLGRVMQAYQRATDVLDQRVADRLGLNRTDMRCLELLFAPEPLSPGELAAAAGLTTGGVTTAIDRLERAGYVTRERAATDRRRVTVHPTGHARRLVEEIYGPIVAEGNAHLARYDNATLTAMAEFLSFATEQQYLHADRLAGA